MNNSVMNCFYNPFRVLSLIVPTSPLEGFDNNRLLSIITYYTLFNADFGLGVSASFFAAPRMTAKKSARPVAMG